MTPFLFGLALFLIACGSGAWAVRNVQVGAQLPLVALQCLLCVVVILGAFVASAEAGRMLARYLGLGAVVLASGVLVVGFATMERAIVRNTEKNDG